MADDLMAERIGRSNATFRVANERLGDVAAEQARAPDEPLPFVCECADVSCTQVIRVPLAEYRRVRSHPRRFLTAPAHETDAIDFVQVVEEYDGYVVTEKTGPAGEIVERLADAGGAP
jgi:hypothetical protein